MRVVHLIVCLSVFTWLDHAGFCFKGIVQRECLRIRYSLTVLAKRIVFCVLGLNLVRILTKILWFTRSRQFPILNS